MEIGLNVFRAFVVIFFFCNGITTADDDGLSDNDPGTPDLAPDLDNSDETPGGLERKQEVDSPMDDLELSSRLESMAGDGIGQMFREMGRMLPNISLGPNMRFPPILQDNPCFESPEQMRELLGDISNAMTDRQSDDDSNEFPEDTDDIFEKLSDTSVQCMMGSMDNATTMTMCHKFSRRRGSKTFSKMMTSGVDCVSALMKSRHSRTDDDDDDDDDDDELSLPEQKIIMQHLRKRPLHMWTETDFDSAWELAPDDIDDDVIEGLSDDLFESSIGKLGRMLARGRGSPSFRAAVRERLTVLKPPKQLQAADIRRLGPGFIAFDVDDIDDMDSDALFEAMFDDLDLDDDDPRHHAIGRVMQIGRNFSTFSPNDVRRLLPFQRGNPQFARKLNPNVLVQALPLLFDLDVGDEAGSLCRALRKSDKYDNEDEVDGTDLESLGRVLTGCGRDFISHLPALAVKSALERINDLDFDDSEARSLLEKFDLGEPKDFTIAKIKMAGKLANAFSLDDFEDMPDDLMDDVFGDLDMVDLDDWKRIAIVRKAIRSNPNKVHSLIFQHAAFANVLGIDDILDIDTGELNDVIKKAAALKVRHGLAVAIMNRLRSLSPRDRPFRARDFYQTGNLVVGLSHDDLMEFPDDKVEVLRMSAQLSDHMDDLTDSQVEDVLEKLRKVYDIDNSDHVNLDEDDVLQTAPFLVHLPEDDFDKLEFSKPAKGAFLQAIARTSAKKSSRKHVQYLFNKAVNMVHELHDDRSSSPDDLNEVQVRQLRGVLPGISAHTIRALPRNSLLRNLDVFEDAHLDGDEGAALAERVMGDDSEWNCRRERLAQLAPYIHYLSEDKLKSICKPELAAASSSIIRSMERRDHYKHERNTEGFIREDDSTREGDDGKVKVIKRIVESWKDDSKRRRRRRTTVGLTCDAIKLMRSKVTLLNTAEIDAIDSAVEFPNCLETFGSYGDWSREKLTHLLNKAKESLGKVSTWSAEHIRQAGSILAALPVHAMKTIQVTSGDAMARIGQHPLMNKEQLNVGVYRWLNLTKMNDVTKISGPELSSLREFVCGLEDKHIAELSAEAFRAASHDLGKLKTCSSPTLRALAHKAIETFGGVISKWPTARIADMGIIVGGFESAHVKQLTANHIAEISPDVIQRMPKETLKEFSSEQMTSFSTNQANAITEVQYRHLAAPQRQVINRKATIGFEYMPGASSHLQHMTFTSLIYVVLCAVFGLTS